MQNTRPFGWYDEAVPLDSRMRARGRELQTVLSRRETLLDMVGAVHATLEPGLIAEALVNRASSWIPLTCWAIVAADLQQQLSVLADNGLEPAFGPALYGVAGWVIRHDEPVPVGRPAPRRRRRLADQSLAAVAFPLRGREQMIGASRRRRSRHLRTRSPLLAATVRRVRSTCC